MTQKVIDIKKVKQEAIGIDQDTSMFDIHRKHPKAQGGDYVLENIEVHTPISHLEIHDNLKKRDPNHEKLKALMDMRRNLLKTKNQMGNRILACERDVDILDEQAMETFRSCVVQYTKELGRLERKISRHLLSMPDKIIHSAIQIKGLGFLTIAQILSYVEIEKAQHASSLWSYVGLDKPSHERYTKNESGGGNKTLRTQLYAMAESFIKTRNIYRDVYDREKAKLAASKKMVKTRNTQGKLIECMWKDTKPGHRHGAAIRKMIKHFLADFWFVWRSLEGLDARPLYVEEILGHTGIVRPAERGWIY